MDGTSSRSSTVAGCVVSLVERVVVLP